MSTARGRGRGLSRNTLERTELAALATGALCGLIGAAVSVARVLNGAPIWAAAWAVPNCLFILLFVLQFKDALARRSFRRRLDRVSHTLGLKEE